MPRFVRMQLRGSKVWARLGPGGELAADEDGRVEIRYHLDDTRTYRASVRNLRPLPAREEADVLEPGPGVDRANAQRKREKPTKEQREPVAPPQADKTTNRRADELLQGPEPILIYTDGACTGNPGPMGIGVVLVDGDQRQEISEYLGMGTNNIAELTAILRALEAVKDRSRTVFLLTDSSYAIGVLCSGWKAKANQNLIARIQELAATFTNLRLTKVAGHAGVSENERCDQLARKAIARARADH